MCGRFAVDDSVDELVKAFVADGGDWEQALTALPNPNIRPTDTIAVLLESLKGLDAPASASAGSAGPTGPGGAPRSPRRVLAPARWSLVPSWSRTVKTSGPTFNARLETLGEKSMWRSPLAKRRCVIPASAYYEWRGERGAKTPFSIGDPDGRRMTIAGLAQWWRPSESAPWLLTATIITQPAVGELAEIHDRMPLVLPESLVDEWIDATRVGDQSFADGIAAASAGMARSLRATEVESVPPVSSVPPGPSVPPDEIA